jgi:exonuclease SbcC
LRLIQDGADLPFAALSAGMQARAAWAFHFALVEKLAHGGFLFLDEPALALDAPSRARFALAARELMALTGAEQMLVVSHDDTFDGVADHTIRMQYDASGGAYTGMGR